MSRRMHITVALAVCAAAGLVAAAAAVPAYITSAIASSSRPDKDRDRDVNRRPDLVIAFAGIKPGQKVGELMPGGGYFSRLFCQIVGPAGHLYTISMVPAVKRDPPPPDAAAGAPPANACSDVLHNPEDTHDAKVFELKGRSDKFLFKFRKPGK